MPWRLPECTCSSSRDLCSRLMSSKCSERCMTCGETTSCLHRRLLNSSLWPSMPTSPSQVTCSIMMRDSRGLRGVRHPSQEASPWRHGKQSRWRISEHCSQEEILKHIKFTEKKFCRMVRRGSLMAQIYRIKKLHCSLMRAQEQRFFADILSSLLESQLAVTSCRTVCSLSVRLGSLASTLLTKGRGSRGPLIQLGRPKQPKSLLIFNAIRLLFWLATQLMLLKPS